MTTLTYIRRLPSYTILKGDNYEDPNIRQLLKERLDSATLEKLDEYTRGMYSQELHYTSFMFYDRPIELEEAYCKSTRDDPFIQQALIHVRKSLSSLKGLTPISKYEMDSVRYIPTSAAGYGFIGNKASNYIEARSRAFAALARFQQYGKDFKFLPDKAFARTQLALKANPKIRHVWGRSFPNILIEGLFAQPLINAIVRTNTPIYIGRDLHKDMPYDIAKLLADKREICCLDYSKFDAQVNAQLVSYAWDLIHELFNFDPESQVVFDFIVELFKNTPILMPDGKLYVSCSGVPSGSYFTQIIDSIVNLIVIYAIQLKQFGTIVDTYVLGDDSIFPVPQGSAFDLQAASHYAQGFNMTVNADKSIIVTTYPEAHFLGHHFHGTKVTRDEFTCLSLALYTEDPVQHVSDTLIRLASLIYDCGFNSFGLLNLYRLLLEQHKLDWKQLATRPISTTPPFINLFNIS